MFVILGLIGAYLIASISGTALIAHYAQQPDPRTQGIGTLSAENLLVISGKEKALAAIVVDGMKGFLALLLVLLFGAKGFALGLGVLIIQLGHMFPLYYGFKGGKGIAAAIGATFLISYFIAIAAIIIWFATIHFTRFISLATVGTMAIMVLLILLSGHFSVLIPYLLTLIAVCIVNLEHIKRLRLGIESRAVW